MGINVESERSRIDVLGPHKILEASHAVVDEVVGVAQSFGLELVQNEIRIEGEGKLNPRSSGGGFLGEHFGVKLNRNGIEADTYDFVVTIDTSVSNPLRFGTDIRFRVSIEGIIPVSGENGKVTKISVITGRGTRDARGIVIRTTAKGDTLLVDNDSFKDEEKGAILKVVFESMKRIAKALSLRNFEVEYTPKGLFDRSGGLMVGEEHPLGPQGFSSS
jgi:hypothetical protein